MKYELKKDMEVYVFSYKKVRDWILVRAGTLESIAVEHTSWGEEITMFVGYPPIITGTHWGDTQFKKELQVIK